MDIRELVVTMEDRVIQGLVGILDSQEFQELVVTQASEGRPVYRDIVESVASQVILDLLERLGSREFPVTVVNPVIREFMVQKVTQVILDSPDILESLVTQVLVEYRDIVESKAALAIQGKKD